MANSADEPNSVAIVGAGVSGLVLALSLYKYQIPCVIYEARSTAGNDIGGAIMFAPNGLKVAREIGLIDKIFEQGWWYDNVILQDSQTGEHIETLVNGGEQEYGLHALRIYRKYLIKVLLEEVKMKKIPIHYDHIFTGIVSETHEVVEFGFQNGTTAKASFLIGADGIRSSVREHIAPGIQAKDAGLVAVVGAIPTSRLGLPEPSMKDLRSPTNQYPLPIGILNPRYGAFVIAPQTHSGNECMIMVTRHLGETSSLERKAFLADGEKHVSMLREGSEEYPKIVQNAVRNLETEQVTTWIFQQLPALRSYVSEKNRVVLVGDAAHAVPPTSGQGASMGLEDVYSLTIMLSRLKEFGSARLSKALELWQGFRHERIERVLELNRKMAGRRLPLRENATSEEIEARTVPPQGDLDALYKLDLEVAVDELLTWL